MAEYPPERLFQATHQGRVKIVARDMNADAADDSRAAQRMQRQPLLR